MNAAPPPPARHFPVIRVFVSSTFSDLVEERNALAKDVWPKLEEYCRQRGFTFQAIDLRWGVPSEAGLDHRTMQICFEELHRAQETSPEPNFLILLGDKYGWRPLPETISETEYARLFEHTQSPGEKRTLEDWYRRDANVIPPHHILRARTDSPDGQDYTRVPDKDGRLHDTDAWLAVQETLWAIVNRAYPASLLRERFGEEIDSIPSSVRFQGSATEQEIWNGALKVENAREHVVAWFREIVTTNGNPEPWQLKRFFDLKPDQSPDLDAADALAALKTQVEQALAPEPILHAQCRWAKDASGAFTGQVTTDHLAPMCEAILTRLRTLILRQINDYWGTDLSAEDATAAAVRGTPQELDLELRDHRRFARERGPVDGFIGRDEQVRAIRDYLQATTNRPLIVHGPSGSGKTALLAYVAQQPFLPGAEAGGVSPLILTRFIGAHPESSTLRGLMTSLCRELRVRFPIPEPLQDTLQKLIEEFYAQLAHATANQPIYVFLDALDQLEAADQSRECFWLRSQILPQAGESPCHARVIASCLSPSPEFPLESEACMPFGNLQSRGLLAEAELGALSETAACELLRRWLADQQRCLTKEQWQSVDAAISASSPSRHPLYLQVLHERLRGWREFDEPEPLPASLPLLIQETLERLCQSNQHGQLPRIALGYLVSARYGLSEGEMLEILFRDPEMETQLEAAVKAYGHHLPPGANRYPVAPWARLRSDLRAYLSERAAPGATVLACYHRQVEQAVRALFLADDATCTERRRILADYFDDRWDHPDAHALMELPNLLLALPDHQRLYDRLSNFAFPMRKAEMGLLESLPDDYTRLGKHGPAAMRNSLQVWQDFLREQGHILRRGVADQTAHQILLQLALEHADDSPVTTAAEAWLSAGRCNWLRLQRVSRQKHVTSNPCRAVLEGHKDGIQGAHLLTNGQILSWSVDGTLQMWDSATGTCSAVIELKSGVRGAVLLPDGQILCWLYDNTLRLLDSSTGTCSAILEGHKNWVKNVLSLPNGRILSCSYDWTLRLWDARTGSCCSVFQEHLGWVNGAMSLPDGHIISWSQDRTLRLWDTAAGTCCAVFTGHKNWILGAQLLSDGQILSWSQDKTLRVWDAKTQTCHAIMEGHTGPVQGALLMPDGQILSWSDDRTLRVWQAATGVCQTVLKGHTGLVKGVLFLNEGRILSWSDDYTLRIWDIELEICRAVLEGHTSSVSGALSLSDGQILSGAADGTLRLWDATTGICSAILDGHTSQINGALSLRDGWILSWSNDKTLRVWDTESVACLDHLEGHTSEVIGALSLVEGPVLSWSADGDLRLWDIETEVCHSILKGHTDGVLGAQLLANGQILSWSVDNMLRLWDAATGTCLVVFDGHTSAINGALSLPGGQILSYSEDATLRLWEAATGACLLVLEGHSGGVLGALSLPDGQIVSWSWCDNALWRWDLGARTCRSVLEGHSDSIVGAQLLPDGRILSWSSDETLRLWDVTTEACLVVLEGHTSAITGALLLPEGRILSWSIWEKSQRLWDSESGACLEVIPEDDLPVRHPDRFYRKRMILQPRSVAEDWCTYTEERTARLFHRLGFTPLPAWQAESDCEARLLQPDGTLVVTQANGQVCILKLHHGNRRVTLAEAEEILRAGGK